MHLVIWRSMDYRGIYFVLINHIITFTEVRKFDIVFGLDHFALDNLRT